MIVGEQTRIQGVIEIREQGPGKPADDDDVVDAEVVDDTEDTSATDSPASGDKK